PGMARRIAGLAKTWLPVITDEHDKAVIVAREMRHPPEWLKRHVRLRDGTCRGLGCRTHWKHCELDHTLAWEHGGKTELANLALRCKPDHLSKHNDGWHTTQEPHGVIRHQTRTGQTYTSYPDGSWVSHGIKPPPPAAGPLHRHHTTTLLNRSAP
ncbi:HNH endonuclease signature motif containing protein, partial [Arthrobacter crystallopoietes]|uniref:HNH endonuclease signature motif containing protein n=1 Tax=Crystallibacter crystallopoietes TaxID=37928 RepID=UPI003D2613DA